MISGATVSAHSYVYDAVDRRRQATLADGSRWGYDYNDRDEVVFGHRFWSDFVPVAGQLYDYRYDNIGNRATVLSGGDSQGLNLRQTGYAVNSLNQYSTITNSTYIQVVGAATATAATTVNGASAYRHIEYFQKELQVNSNAPVWCNISAVASLGGTNTTNSGSVLIPPASQSLSYDADGNLTSDTLWTYTWDAENRLVAMETAGAAYSNGVPRQKLQFTNDFQGRRFSKTVLSNWNGSAYANTNTVLFVYDLSAGQAGGWNLLAILDSQLSVLQSFTRGLDLSGTMEGAGGIGGLLIVTWNPSPATNCFVAYDGNGNVMALVNAADKTTMAQYEYSPFGELIRATGPLAMANPFRWSTKFSDEESQLVYYGYRYYSPSLGRWISRDPFAGGTAKASPAPFPKRLPPAFARISYPEFLPRGLNLYDLAGNNSVNYVDSDGEFTLLEKLSTTSIMDIVYTT